MKKDYYEILGVAKDADAAAIKKKYRSMALKHHPDRVPEEKKAEAEEKFKEISEAYGVLSDPQKRKLYDQYGHSGIDQRFTAEDIFGGADFSSIFGESGLGDILGSLFGGGGGGGFDMFGGGRGGGARARRRGRDIRYEVEVSMREAFSGVKKTIKVPRYEHCNSCNGTGAKNGIALKECATCRGQGQVLMSSGFFRMAQTCSACRGAGKTIETPCPECEGKGAVKVTRKLDVTIPPGVDNDTRMRVNGEGEVGSGGPGDLYLDILVKPQEGFRRRGTDIEMDLPLGFVKAALGGEVKVPTLNGAVTMKIPSGTQSGKVFRLRGKGMPDLHGAGKGDQYVRVMLQVPERLSAEQKRLLEDFAKASGEDLTKQHDSFTEKIKNVFK